MKINLSSVHRVLSSMERKEMVQKEKLSRHRVRYYLT
ncbi:hypothetical protein HYT57_00510 [Candidatus Woesearchaeota archaeon]|nr:hypothetical protein [Candidatus Woesearchaeota archaeon]